MRDVHDGIGARLLDPMIQARAGEVKGETLIGGLEAASTISWIRATGCRGRWRRRWGPSAAGAEVRGSCVHILLPALIGGEAGRL